MNAAIHVTGLNKTFTRGRQALQDIELRVSPGEMVALIGASGSGKSTLLRHLAGLMAGDSGTVEVHGRTVQQGGRIARDVRSVRAGVGFVFQQFNLVDRLPVIVNVLAGMLHKVPLWRSLGRVFTAQERALGIEALRRVGIGVAAAELAQRDLLDIMSSDYVPSSLLQSAFLLRDRLGWTLPRAVNTVSRNPAQAIGLADRGEIAAGMRADVLRVQECAGMPIVRGSWCRGERAF